MVPTGAWCIISNPLVLAMDLRDAQMLDSVWSIITNREAVAINQAWHGDSGRLVAQSADSVSLPNCGSGAPCSVPRWMVWSKALPPLPNATTTHSSRAAIFLLNNNNAPATVATSLAAVRGLGACGTAGCAVRSVWEKRDLPATHGDGELSALLVTAPNSSLIRGCCWCALVLTARSCGVCCRNRMTPRCLW